MRCPYVDCRNARVDGTFCAHCCRQFKLCPCGESNRSFSCFCHGCGQALVEDRDAWLVHKGSVQKTACYRFAKSHSFDDLILVPLKTIQLPDACRGLLLSDGMLIAASVAGTLSVRSIYTEKPECDEQVQQRLTCHPLISGNHLYLGVENALLDYNLGLLSSPNPRLHAYSEQVLDGVPIDSILSLNRHLFLLLKDRNGDYKVVALNTAGTQGPEVLFEGRIISSLAANEPLKRVYFLSQSRGQIFQHIVSWSGSGALSMEPSPVAAMPLDLEPRAPLVAMGSKLFTICGPNSFLCRIDTERSLFELKTGEHVKSFAMASINHPVIIRSEGVRFEHKNIQEPLEHGLTCLDSVLIMGDHYVVVGLNQGIIRIYQWNNPARYQQYNVGADNNDIVTHLAAYRHVLAVGTANGRVTLLQMGDPKKRRIS